MARRRDIGPLIALFRTIFKTYPTPLIHRSYLEHVFETESLFVVCEHGGKVVAAASAELHPNVRAAELTDCATLTEARGKGLMSCLLQLLETELLRRDYICAYTMARARSFGMNMVFYQLGYEFNGRLVNNCDIFGAFEDMNIWVRDLRKYTPALAPAPAPTRKKKKA
jgi:putative beta-lysine N-acetyltransferase